MAHNLAERDPRRDPAVRSDVLHVAAPRAAVVAVLTSPPARDGAELRAVAGQVDALEVRADLVGDLDVEWLRQQFAGTLVYTLRSVEEGGQFRGDRGDRHARLAAAATGYDQVDLEAATDVTPALLAAVPTERRRLSRHLGAVGGAGIAQLMAVLD